MNNDRRQTLKLIWLLANVASIPWVLIAARVWEIEPLPSVFVWILVLSFPLSLVTLILFQALALIFDLSLPSIELLSLFGLAMLVTGYVQWFHVVPRLFQSKRVATLGISNIRTVNAGTRLDRATAARERRVQRARLNGAPTLPFDNSGRTPLERMIDQN